MSKYIVSIGLETHVQLKTRSKIFCGCQRQFGDEPNRSICPVCLGYPGAMPVLNWEAVHLTVRTGLMIGSTISRFSKFDRKSYFYPDMPKNYQISQYDKPLCLGGRVPITVDGREKTIHITRIHLEEDVGKSTHFATSSGVDFNRAGTPLMEIVTEPELSSADETFAYLQVLKGILEYGEVSDCNLEEGNIRCDVNCSVRPEGQAELGTKTELKNMNTFKGIYRALTYEIRRQIETIEGGGVIQQETRRWDDAAGVTLAMRSKEYAHDYRYFPEPDLAPVVLSDEQIETWRAALPELPEARKARFIKQFHIPAYDAGVLVADKAIADFYEAAAGASSNPKAVSNWVMTELMRLLSEADQDIRETKIQPDALAGLVKLTEDKVISSTGAKEVFAVLFAEGGDPVEIVERKGLAQVSDASAIDAFVEQAIAENPKAVEEYRGGKANALQFLVGQVMRFSRGKANPQLARDALLRRL